MIRPIEIVNDIAYIRDRHGNTAIIDAIYVPLAQEFNWHLNSRGYFSTNVSADWLRDGVRRHMLLHHLIIGNPVNGYVTDHVNGDPLDNRRANLRICQHAENMRNRSKQKNNSTGFRGVSWHKSAEKYQAHISLNGKDNHLGLYDTAEAASAAYEAASVRLHGEYRRVA